MKQIVKSLLVGVCLFTAASLQAQTVSDLRLNEVLVVNTNDYQDDFGQQNAWFEIFNIGYGTVDIGGCYLSTDPNNLKMYTIPRGDILTKIKPRQHILFWADNQAFRGTFHVNFVLDGAKELILTSNDGRTILDRVALPAQPEPNKSYGRTMDGVGSHGAEANGEGWQVMERTSPSTNNVMLDGASKSVLMKETDPYGWLMAVTAMSVVFSALILLYFAFKFIGRGSLHFLQKKANEHSTGTAPVQVADVSGETYAAIAMALHLYANEDEFHDVETTILTIDKVRRSYSPWSSKRQSLRQEPILRKR